jgi:hypothetical protein
MGRSISGVIEAKRLNRVSLFDALTRALKAAALAALLAFVWAMPASAHPGHGASSKLPVQPASNSNQAVAELPAVASLDIDEVSVCRKVQPDMSAPEDSSQRSGAMGRSCCGTMCTVAAIELLATSLPVRSSHRFRRYLPPETHPHTGTPNLPARPPRTSDIA